MTAAIAEEAIAHGGAKWAQNVALASGVARPIALVAPTAPPGKLWNDSGMVGEIAAAELATLTPPGAPTAAKVWKALPLGAGAETGWIEIAAVYWLSYLGAETAGQVGHVQTSVTLTLGSVIRTRTGFQIQATLNDTTASLDAAVEYELHGPRFYYHLIAPGTGIVDGGPAAEHYFPPDGGEISADPYVIPFSVPLVHGGRTYGELSLRDVAGPLWDASYTPAANTIVDLEGGQVLFTFDCNYQGVDARTRLWRFVQALVDADANGNREFPPSEILTVTVDPGEALTLTLPGNAPAGTGAHRHLYEGGASGDRWLLRADDIAGNAPTWADDGLPAQEVELPPYGNFGDSGEAAVETFRKWSVIYHDFGVALVNVGAKAVVCFSDYKRLHAWPEEWMVKSFSAAGVGLDWCAGGVLAWIGTELWLFAGHNPAQMSRQRLSSTYPLLSDKGKGRIGGTVYWVTSDGLAASSGGPPELVTRDIYTAAQWAAMTPASMTLMTSNDTLLIAGGTVNIHVERTGRGLEFSEYTALTGVQPSWWSGTVLLDEPAVMDWARVTADANVELSVYADGAAPPAALQNQPAGIVALAGLGPARSWAVKAKLLATDATKALRRIELVARSVIEAGATTVVTPGMVEGIFGDVWLHWKGAPAQIAAVLVTLGGNAAAACRVRLADRYGNELTAAGGEEYDTVRALSSETGLVALYSKTLDAADLARVQVLNESDDGAYNGVVESVTVITRRTRNVGEEDLVIQGARTGADIAGIPEWMYTTYVFGRRHYVVGVTVQANNYEELACNLSLDGGEAVQPLGTLGRLYAPLEAPAQANQVELDFGGELDNEVLAYAARVARVRVHAQEPETIGPGGARIRSDFRDRLFKFDEPRAIAAVGIGVHGGAWTGSLELTRDLDAAGTTWNYALEADGAAPSPSRRLIPAPRASQVEGSLWLADLEVTGGLPFLLELLPRREVDCSGLRQLRVGGRQGAAARNVVERYNFGRPVKAASFKVESAATTAAPLTLELWPDGSLGAPVTLTITSGRELLAPAELGTFRTLDYLVVDASGDLASYNTLTLWLEEAEPLGGGGYHQSDPEHTRGLLLTLEEPGTLSAMRVEWDAASWPTAAMVLSVKCDGTLLDFGAGAGQQNQAVTDGGLILLPAASGTQWWIDLDPDAGGANHGPVKIKALHVWGRLGRMAAGPASTLDALPADVPEWLKREAYYNTDAEVVSALVRCTGAAPVLWLTKNGGARTSRGAMADDVELALSGLEATHKLAADFAGGDMAVAKLSFFTREEREIGVAGLALPGMQMTRGWLGHKARFREPGSFDVGQVAASSYDGLTLTVGGQTWAVASAAEFALTWGDDEWLGEAQEWEWSVARPAGAEIYGIKIVGRVEWPLKTGVWTVRQAEEPLAWICRRLVATQPARPAAARVLATAYPVSLRLRGDAELYDAVSIPSQRAVWLPRMAGARRWMMDVTAPAGARIIEATVGTGMDGM